VSIASPTAFDLASTRLIFDAEHRGRKTLPKSATIAPHRSFDTPTSCTILPVSGSTRMTEPLVSFSIQTASAVDVRLTRPLTAIVASGTRAEKVKRRGGGAFGVGEGDGA